jgi:hypothetical protein
MASAYILKMLHDIIIGRPVVVIESARHDR